MSAVQRYPNGMPRVAWICGACVANLGGGNIPNHVGTFHVGECGVCKRQRAVTEPRDYAWNSCSTGDCG